MMNRGKITLIVLSSVLSMTGCSNKKKAPTMFGEFSCYGYYLQEYATKDISASQAKQILSSKSAKAKKGLISKESEETAINFILDKYAGVETTVYYLVNANEKKVGLADKVDYYQGTDFKSILQNNHYEPFGQMIVKYIYMIEDFIDDLEAKNDEFKSNTQNVAPFSQPYTYHTDKKGRLIVQTHSFAEIPSSTEGGIGSTFRQDCELVFDGEGKIELWQSSLGLYTATPTGTAKQGLIFETSFDWQIKE